MDRRGKKDLFDNITLVTYQNLKCLIKSLFKTDNLTWHRCLMNAA